tara:strand:- start:1984 stop:2880 length:897 start_codon:yes stop_codon:yes gene_type:complete
MDDDLPLARSSATSSAFFELLRSGGVYTEIHEVLIDHPEWARRKTVDGDTALHVVCYSSSSCHGHSCEIVLEAWPEAARVRNARGKLPIHFAAHFCPAKFVLNLLRAYPEAARVPTQHGLLPLHFAAAHAASTVEAMLAVEPRAARCAARSRDLPIHNALRSRAIGAEQKANQARVVELLVDAFPSCVRVAGNGGDLPIHLALINHAAAAAVRALLALDGRTSRVANGQGNTPLQLLSIAHSPDDVQTAVFKALCVKEEEGSGGGAGKSGSGLSGAVALAGVRRDAATSRTAAAQGGK